MQPLNIILSVFLTTALAFPPPQPSLIQGPGPVSVDSAMLSFMLATPTPTPVEEALSSMMMVTPTSAPETEAEADAELKAAGPMGVWLSHLEEVEEE